MDPKLKELSDCRLQKARQNLEVVEALIRDGYYTLPSIDPIMPPLMQCVRSMRWTVLTAASTPESLPTLISFM